MVTIYGTCSTVVLYIMLQLYCGYNIRYVFDSCFVHNVAAILWLQYTVRVRQLFCTFTWEFSARLSRYNLPGIIWMIFRFIPLALTLLVSFLFLHYTYIAFLFYDLLLLLFLYQNKVLDGTSETFNSTVKVHQIPYHNVSKVEISMNS